MARKVRTVQLRNEMWLHSPKVRDTLSRAMAWAEKHPPKESDLKALERKIGRTR